MTYPSKKRDFYSYSMKAIPDGLYMDHTTMQGFVSTSRLAKLVEEFDGTIDHFIKADSVLQNSMEIALVQTGAGLKFVRVHPESTVKAVVKEFQPDVFEIFKGCSFDELLDGLSRSEAASSDEPISDESQQQWTLYEWMIGHCEIVLSGRLFNQFKSKVHKVYKETYRRDPEKSYRNQANNPKQVSRLQVYVPTDFPILQLCYLQTLMEVRFK
jgi:hypothetical protein